MGITHCAGGLLFLHDSHDGSVLLVYVGGYYVTSYCRTHFRQVSDNSKTFKVPKKLHRLYIFSALIFLLYCYSENLRVESTGTVGDVYIP